MSRTARIALFLFTTILLLFTIFWFSPVSHLPSSLLAKVPSFFEHQEDNCNCIFKTVTYKDGYYVKDSENQGNSSGPENPVVDEKDVVVLTEKNFSDFITRNQYVMVEFYASWCFWSRKLVPEYSAAATMLKGEAVLAKVEATEENELARNYKIQGYPTLYLFDGGVQKASYYGERTRNAIATWMRQKMAVFVQTVTTAEEAERILGTNSVIVMGFLDTLEGQDTEELAAASKLHPDVNFYQTDDADVARLFRIDQHIKRPALVLLKWEVANRSHMVNSPDQQCLDFVSLNKFHAVITFTVEDAAHILGNPMKQLWLFATKYSLEIISTFEEAAKAFRDKLLFVYVETDDLDAGLGANLAYQFGVPEGSPRVVAYMANGDKYIYRDELTFGGIKSFAEEFLEDKLSIQSVPTSETVIQLPSDSHNPNPSLIPHA
ncbi:unnamed protein product [Dovyalis caffra]|uniref:Thioredoxin domain-containing protein n=1 Tax=Dovyalis caffra TaxID=77055 RepID=A0AAV1QXF1_9ROSI|nr:unnamed protein product [Dovyalis caffra]